MREKPRGWRTLLIGAVFGALLVALVFGVIAVWQQGIPSLLRGSFGPTPTPTPIPVPRIVGAWSGCIQGNLGPNEAMTLNINSEEQTGKTGTFEGIYGEDYYLYYAFYNETISGDWNISNTEIDAHGDLQFLVAPVKNYLYFTPPTYGQETMTYLFTGALTSGALSGTVMENNDGIMRNWVLYPNTENTCPWSG